MSLYHLQKQYEEDNETIMKQLEDDELDDRFEANCHISREKKYPNGESTRSNGVDCKWPAALIPTSASNIGPGSPPNNGTPDSEKEVSLGSDVYLA